MFITCALVLSVLMLAAEKHQATAFAPVRILHYLLLSALLTTITSGWYWTYSLRLSSVSTTHVSLLAQTTTIATGLQYTIQVLQ